MVLIPKLHGLPHKKKSNIEKEQQYYVFKTIMPESFMQSVIRGGNHKVIHDTIYDT